MLWRAALARVVPNLARTYFFAVGGNSPFNRKYIAAAL